MTSPLQWLYETAVRAHGGTSRALPSGFALPPIQLFIEVTDCCNLRCRMCFYQGRLGSVDRPEKPAPGLLTPAEMVEMALSLPTARLVSLSGGEPFARSDFLEILEALCRIRKVHIETNATLIGPEQLRHLATLGAKSLLASGLVSVDVSIHGDEATHDRVTGLAGSFQASMGAVEGLLEARRSLGRAFPKVNLKTTILRENLGCFPATAALGVRAGADFVIFKIEDPGKVSFDLDGGRTPISHQTFRPLDGAEIVSLDASLDRVRRAAGENGARPGIFFLPFGLPSDEIRRHYSGAVDLASYGCRHPWSRIGVMPRGDIYVCKVFGCGNVRTGPIAAEWNSPALRSFRRRIRDVGLLAECEGCCFLEHRGSGG